MRERVDGRLTLQEGNYLMPSLGGCELLANRISEEAQNIVSSGPMAAGYSTADKRK